MYQVDRLTRPLLIIHGTADARVALEHSLRLRTVLVAAGRAPQWLPLFGLDHALSKESDRIAVYTLSTLSDAFLADCLDLPRASGTGAASGL